MISSGSTVFRFDFDIFSMAPISTGSPVAISLARRASPAPSMLDLGRLAQSPFGLAVGLVHHHALGEQAGERLVDAEMAGRASSRG